MVIFLQFLMSSLNRFLDDIYPCLLFPHVYSEYLNGDSFLHPSLSFYKQYLCTYAHLHSYNISPGHFRTLSRTLQGSRCQEKKYCSLFSPRCDDTSEHSLGTSARYLIYGEDDQNLTKSSVTRTQTIQRPLLLRFISHTGQNISNGRGWIHTDTVSTEVKENTRMSNYKDY